MRQTALILLVPCLAACVAQEPTGATASTPEPETPTVAEPRVDRSLRDAPRREPTADAEQGASNGGTGASDEPLPPDFDGPRIPARFHGVYAREGACDTAGDESRLELTFDRVAFHESTGRVRNARGSGDDLEVAVELTGEGETREATYRYRLDDGSLIDREGGMVRVRCPQKAG